MSGFEDDFDEKKRWNTLECDNIFYIFKDSNLIKFQNLEFISISSQGELNNFIICF